MITCDSEHVANSQVGFPILREQCNVVHFTAIYTSSNSTVKQRYALSANHRIRFQITTFFYLSLFMLQ